MALRSTTSCIQMKACKSHEIKEICVQLIIQSLNKVSVAVHRAFAHLFVDVFLLFVWSSNGMASFRFGGKNTFCNHSRAHTIRLEIVFCWCSNFVWSLFSLFSMLNSHKKGNEANPP